MKFYFKCDRFCSTFFVRFFFKINLGEKMNRMKLGCALLLIASLAQAEDTNKWYAGASIGEAKVSGVSFSTARLDKDSDTAYKVYGGYQFNKYLATELHYADLGTLTLKDSTQPQLDIKSDFESFGITAVASYPVHKNIEPFVKAGAHHWKGKATGTDASGNPYSYKTDKNKLIYGLGVNFPITDSISIRTEYEIMNLDESEKYKFLSAGLVYKF